MPVRVRARGAGKTHRTKANLFNLLINLSNYIINLFTENSVVSCVAYM